MIRSSGHADLPLHTGTVPRWLADRMCTLGTLITEALVQNYGQDEVLVRLSDPLWFQSLGAVMGMDWHSSGITTSVMYALKRGINPRSQELGLYICGGRGKYSRQTPAELLEISSRTGLDGDALVQNSRLVAKVDNNALQDGFQLYQHNFILSSTGKWTVVQQGMNTQTQTARRYHWSSIDLRSFVESPHTGVVGQNCGQILNLTDPNADSTRSSILEMAREEPDRILGEILQIGRPSSQIILMQEGKVSPSLPRPRSAPGLSATPSPRGTNSCAVFPPKTPAQAPVQGELFPELVPEQPQDAQILYQGRNLVMPRHHQVLAQDVDLKRLGGVLATAYQNQPQDFEGLLLTPGLGPRTLQSLALVSEVIYGTPSRFTDPARFSFAHGGKDGHPFPVPLKVYDKTIRVLQDSIEKSRMGYNDKSECIRRLHQTALAIEQHCSPKADFDAVIAYEKAHSQEWDGRTV